MKIDSSPSRYMAVILLGCALLWGCSSSHASSGTVTSPGIMYPSVPRQPNQRNSLPPSPSVRKKQGSTEKELSQKAMELFRLAQTENHALAWDECLAEKAHARARTMVNGRYFAHKSPGTGKNPAWGLVARCVKARFAGENLSRGEESAEIIHNAWMESPTHRKNLQNHKFSHLGVGCFQNICVQLFAGF